MSLDFITLLGVITALLTILTPIFKLNTNLVKLNANFENMLKKIESQDNVIKEISQSIYDIVRNQRNMEKVLDLHELKIDELRKDLDHEKDN